MGGFTSASFKPMVEAYPFYLDGCFYINLFNSTWLDLYQFISIPWLDLYPLSSNWLYLNPFLSWPYTQRPQDGGIVPWLD